MMDYVLLFLLLEFSLSLAAVALLLHVSSKKGREFVDWLILVMIFFAIIKLANAFLIINGIPMIQDVVATLDLGFATAFTTFVFLRSQEVGLV